MKIGLYGGTFDPIHLGHLKIAKASLEQFKLDELWFIPSKLPPHKKDISSEEDRLNMLRISLKDEDNKFKINTYEYEHKEISYSYKTLQAFKNLFPDDDFYFVMGEDSLIDFKTWKNPDIISKFVTFIIAPRDNNNIKTINKYQKEYEEKYNASFLILNISLINISSTSIRALASQGKTISKYVKHNVSDYIYEHKLYK